MTDWTTAVASGAFVILGSLIAAGSSYLLHRLKITADEKAQKRGEALRLKYVKAMLRSDLGTLARHAREIPGIVKVYKASNATVSDETKARCTLRMPREFSRWEGMSLLPGDILDDCVTLIRLVEANNYDIAKTDGAFGDNNWGPHIAKQAEGIARQASTVAAKLQGQTPPTYLAGS